VKKVSLKSKLALPIKGIQKTTLVDYPGKIASTIFLAGCNFRCPYCHNVPLLKDTEVLPDIPEAELLLLLKERKKYIDGVCITGGEPTLYPELPELIKKIKALGYQVKLDTNGSNPKMLKELIKKKLIDHIAMDIKGSEDNYAESAGAEVDLERIRESVELIKQGGVKYEFRTTVLPRFFKKEDAVKIGRWLAGADKYCLQQFEKKGGVLDPQLMNEQVYSGRELHELAEILKQTIKEVEIRGVP